MSDGLKKSAEMYAGCVSGALPEEEYLQIIRDANFQNIEIKQRKSIQIPDDIINNYLDEEEIRNFKNRNFGLFSITVTGVKLF